MTKKSWVKVLGVLLIGIGGGLWWQFIISPTTLLGIIAGLLIAGGSYFVLVFPTTTGKRVRLG